MAKEEGISDREVAAVQAIVMAVSAGRVGAQLREVRSTLRAREASDRQQP